jgi:carboxymethylenebutenolidase
MSDTIELPVDSGTMGLYVAEPAGTAKGAIVVLQEAFGVNEHMRDVTDRFAAQGYLAVTPHLYHRSGDPELGYEDMTEVIPFIMQLTVNDLEIDLQATLDHLRTRGFEGRQVAVIGYCMGGSVSFLAGCYWELGAAISFYGGGITQGRFGMPPLIDLAPTLQTPWLGLFGDLDPSIPTDEVEALRDAATRSSVPTEVVRYADANHGFSCDARDSYHESSAKDGFDRTIAWLEKHVAQ